MRFNLWILREDAKQVICYGEENEMTALAASITDAATAVLPDLAEPSGCLGQ
jgi:hypothetical protein